MLALYLFKAGMERFGDIIKLALTFVYVIGSLVSEKHLKNVVLAFDLGMFFLLNFVCVQAFSQTSFKKVF